ncbi:hypothetical protein PMAYCL1PPCAC_21574, partial [Pristionchus mayeri]
FQNRRFLASRMEQVRKYGSAVNKLYREEGVASTKAAAYRAKIRETIASLCSSDHSIDRDELLECMWQLAYYPVARGAQMDDHLRLVLCLLAGELQLMTPPSAVIFVYVGDLHRYQQSALSLRLARLYYTRAVMEDPEAARPLNQLSIMMDPLPALRCLLHAASCCKKFRATERNLEGRLSKLKESPSSSPSLIRLATLIEAAMTEKKTEEEPYKTAAKEWTESLKEFAKEMRGGKKKGQSPSAPQPVRNGVQQVQQGEEKKEKDTLLLLHCLSIAAGVAHPSNSSALIDLIQSSLRILLEREKEEEEEEVIKIGRRRRSASDSEEEERRVVRGRRRRDSEEDEDEEDLPGKGKKKEKDDSMPAAASPSLLVALSISLEWIQRVDERRTGGDQRYAPTKVIKGKMKLEQIVNMTLQRLNEMEGMTERVECLLDADLARKSLVEWRVVERMEGEEGDERAIEWIALWTASIVREEEGSIQQSPSGFVPRSDHSIMRKMAALHMNAQSNKNERPLSVVLQANVLERRLGKIRSLADRSHLIWYVPASELARLDETKSASKAARDALRFIETEQHTRVRVLPTGGIAEALARATAENAPTALLSLDTVKDAESLPPHTKCLHVDSFTHSYK